MLNWFLDLEFWTFTGLYMFIVIVTSLLMIKKELMATKGLSISATMGIQITFALCIFLPITLPMITLEQHYKAFDLKQEYYSSGSNITLGEAWCIYKDYTGEICKDYVIYVLDEQKIAEQKKREKELKKQQKEFEKLEKETLRKNKILTNYEKLIEEIKKSKIENNDFLRHDNDFTTTQDDNKSSQCVLQNEGGNKT